MVGCVAQQVSLPVWLDVLLNEKFFLPCHKHAKVKKCEKNMFCVECSIGICQHCSCSHASHHLLQIRRYVYHDVIRLHDIDKLLDCSGVQAYIINGARVVFLNERPHTKSAKVLGSACKTCERSLQMAYRFCSLACKVRHGGQILIAGVGMVGQASVDENSPNSPRFLKDLLDSDGNDFYNAQSKSLSSLSSSSTAGSPICHWPFDSGCHVSNSPSNFLLCTLPTWKRRKLSCYSSTLSVPVSTCSVSPFVNRRKGKKPQRSPFC